MESYFTRNISDTGRFFFIFGHTKDRFCEDNHIAVDLDRILYKHLKDVGYKRIIFYSLDEQLYFYDIDSFNSTKEPNETPKERVIEKPVVKPNRLRGPIPGKFKSATNMPSQNHTSEQTETPTNVKAGKLHFGRMDANRAFKRIDNCVRDEKKTKIKTAVIFTNADDFINYFIKEDIDRRVFESFNKFDGLDPDNHNIVLFVFPEGNQCEIFAREKYNNTFFKEKILEANTINLNPPAFEEIRNTINHYRLMHGLKVDFKCFDTVCKRIARELCKGRRQLKWLMVELDKIIEKSIILDADRCDIMLKKKDNETAMQKLDKLIGMESVKKEIKMLKSIKKPDEKSVITESHHSRILPLTLKKNNKFNLHYVITGNPGTGKTTAAKLLGEIYYELGYLESGHTVKVTRDHLVAEFVGGTAPKTKKKIEEAMGGVLFIDEAYSLAKGGENDFGQEAVDTLVEAMTDRNGQFAVVVAGYPKEMEEFLNLNPGLKDRFEGKVHIEDYTPSELFGIFNMNMSKEKFCPSEKLSSIIMDFLENWYNTRDKNWSNARGVEKLINRMYKSWGLRGGEKTESGEPILDIVDISYDLQQHCKPSKESKEDAMSRLNKLIGLSGVKEKIEELKLKIKFKGATEPGHYVFAGNPGTGKTTVARLLGDILREEGVLRRGHVVEVLRQDLVGEYSGHTAPKTTKKLEEALDGIFFLDEAYTLNEGDREGGFGKEAIDTILAFMENNRKRLCVIFAGYTEDMRKFIQTNSGLTSRISETITFDDYSTDEMVEISQNFAKDFIFMPEYIQKSREIFDFWLESKDRNFGNARDVRKYFDECETVLYKRLSMEYKNISDVPEESRKTLTGLDIPSKYLHIVQNESKQAAKDAAMEELRKLTGLTRVKGRIEKLKRKIQFEGATEPGHYVFSGNPGTGKTTVARLLGDILREEGVLKKGHVIEVLRKDLVAGYVGQTAIQTTKKLEEALDGIFFVDEAYSLNDVGQGSSFGKEAIDTILAFMENNRTRICAIFAGYTGDMESFIQTNPGLTSRISETLIFDDYNTEEMVKILHNFARGFVLAPEYIQKSRQIFDFWLENKDCNFGNARDVRKYFGECKDVLYERLASEYKISSEIPEETRKTLTGLDIPSKYLSVVGDLANE